MKHILSLLEYDYDSLEPYIDRQTMEIHHKKHHQAYIDNFNKAVENYPELKNKDIREILSNLNKVPEDIRLSVKNHGGGYFNHSFFWKILKKDIEPKGEIKEAIERQFGSLEEFQDKFKKLALSHFGSGWVWLILDKGKLSLLSTPNQDSPISDGKIPLLTLDIWEHAYYLKYQNKRADYIDAFFHVIDWSNVNKNYQEAIK
ncbi:MAG: superoxide dismutase [Candidatus Nanoarchaeia archaeon]|nr:superoxide dismutase [Candidatus Nanoarchaeia archaeon]